MKRLFIIFLILSAVIPPVCGQTEEIVIVQKKPQKSVHGVVKDANGAPIDGVLVEMYTHPEWAYDKWRNVKNQGATQKRVARCVTGEDGRFSFSGVRAGDFELRFEAKGFDRLRLCMKVRPHSSTGTNKAMEIGLKMAT